MSANWHTYPDAAAAAEACAHQLIALLEEALSGNEFATLAISGGATPKPMYRHLAAARFPWNRIHLFWVDERCVPTPPATTSSHSKT
jgi:6-phosphogluconolactonase